MRSDPLASLAAPSGSPCQTTRAELLRRLR